MLQVAAGCCGGAWLGKRCGALELPRLRRAADESAPFKLSVRVLSASVPTLAAPGLLLRQRPRVEVSLGQARKETELGEFTSGGSAGSGGGHRHLRRVETLDAQAAAAECPWHFGDTLTFTAHLSDLRGAGLRVRLRCQSDVRLGPLQLELASTHELGACSVGLRQRVLPACVLERHREADARACGDGGCRVWESPVLLLPLACEDGPVAHVAVAFGVTADPDVLMGLASDAERPLVEKVAMPLRLAVRGSKLQWARLTNEHGLGKCSSFSDSPQSTARDSDEEDDGSPGPFAADVLGPPVLARGTSFCAPLPGPPGSLRAAEAAAARSASGCTAECWPPACVEEVFAARKALCAKRLRGPDLEPEGWVCRQSASGRTFWHHTSLGPAPWGSEAANGCAMPHR